MGILTLQKWVPDSDGFGGESDSDEFGRIPGPQIWKSPTQLPMTPPWLSHASPVDSRNEGLNNICIRSYLVRLPDDNEHGGIQAVEAQDES